MKKSAIIVVIVFMMIGFAAVSTSLIINSNIKVSENETDFDVYFSKARLDTIDVYESVISQDKKTITFNTNNLSKVGDKSILTYEVTNNSANYDAEVSVTCVPKDGTTAKYTSIKNELENNATIVKAKETLNGTLTVSLDKTSTEEVNEEYTCTLEFNAVERNDLGKEIPDSVSFSTDSWDSIQRAVKTGKTSKYNVGDTKEINLTNFGKHKIRIANMSECTNGETSETACGFVIEFADIITKQQFNSTNTNVGGWRDSELRAYINETLYNSLPIDLQNVIAITNVISSHGSTSGETNFETQDKLYLLSSHEVYDGGTNNEISARDTAYNNTKQLDYYKNQKVTSSSYTGAIKKYNGSDDYWWLRSARSSNTLNFLRVDNDGYWGSHYANSSHGISPAFRIA